MTSCLSPHKQHRIAISPVFFYLSLVWRVPNAVAIIDVRKYDGLVYP